MTANQKIRPIEIELLAIDLSTCTRCVGTLGSIEAAIESVRRDLPGTELRVKKTVIASEQQAREREFLSSPTIRVNGRDIVLETKESKCVSCTDLCGCDEGTECRVWTHEGKEYTEAPQALIVAALRRALAGGKGTERPAYPGVPENLKRFFKGKEAKAAQCCAPKEKAGCCGEAKPGSCGCREPG
ncbi:MAG: DUF2703 domain-containing protein [Elusimicrobiota bacterium]|nr:DUF2703 domain-containing protein [Elusimicrobiota bacterium]